VRTTWCELKFLLEGLYAINILILTELTAKLKKIATMYSTGKNLFLVLGGDGYRKHVCLHTAKVIYPLRIVGRRQVTVRFTN